MPYEVLYHQEYGVVEVVYCGEISHDDFVGAHEDAWELAKEKGVVRFVSDNRRVKGSPPVRTIVRIPELYDRLGVGRGNAVAVVLPSRGLEARTTKLYVKMARAIGRNVEAFNYREEALEWLLDSDLNI